MGKMIFPVLQLALSVALLGLVITEIVLQAIGGRVTALGAFAALGFALVFGALVKLSYDEFKAAKRGGDDD